MVLEIGAGSGYMAALLAHKARHVTTVEIDPALVSMAANNLRDYGVSNVTVVQGDGARGWQADQVDYDLIMVSGSLQMLPDSLLQQVKVGGRLLAIVGEAPIMSAQLVTRVSEVAFHTEVLFETQVAPLRNAQTLSHFTF